MVLAAGAGRFRRALDGGEPLRPITRSPDVELRPRRFVPEDFEPAGLDGLVDALLQQPVWSGVDLVAWIEDWGELDAVILAGAGRRRIAMTRDTTDASLREEYMAFKRDVIPIWRVAEDRLARRLLGSVHRERLPARFSMFLKKRAATAALFSEENLPLKTRESELGTDYFELTGSLRAQLNGESLTLQQATRLLEDPDRAVREGAWRASFSARVAARAKSEAILDEMLEVRGQLAANSGCADFIEYRFRELNRFDYTREEGRAFRDAVEAVVVPVLARRADRRRESLGVKSLRPWDMAVDTGGTAPPLAPDEETLIGHTATVLGAVDARFGEEFDLLVRNGLLDLWTRPGKAPGGYNHGVADIRLPFIFGNAAGGRGDLRLLLHEGGHAMHTILTRDECVLGVAKAPIEFCEVASMAMELFGFERLSAIYPESDARAVLAGLLEARLRVLAWIATIDGFQDWIYTHPGQRGSEREAAWMEIRARFTPGVDYSGLEEQRAAEWTGQQHVFLYPLYYIEYALAWMGAVQVWQRFLLDPVAAVESYRGALALGGSRPLPELFSEAGARFGTGEPLLREVVEAMEARLVELEG